jgi:hypothetical protein
LAPTATIGIPQPRIWESIHQIILKLFLYSALIFH